MEFECFLRNTNIFVFVVFHKKNWEFFDFDDRKHFCTKFFLFVFFVSRFEIFDRWKFLQKNSKISQNIQIFQIVHKMGTKKTKQNDKKLRKRIFLWRFCVLLNISEFVKNLKIKFLKNSTIDEELIKAKFYGSSLVVFSKVCFHFCFPTCQFLEASTFLNVWKCWKFIFLAPLCLEFGNQFFSTLQNVKRCSRIAEIFRNFLKNSNSASFP